MRNQFCRVRAHRLFACLAALALVGAAAQPLGVAVARSGGVEGGVSAIPPPQGGLYKDLVADGQQGHHAIATDVLKDAGYSTDCGPAIRMTIPDHRKTASWGSSEAAEKYRKDQANTLANKSLSESERFRRLLETDIKDIRFWFPDGRYDAAIAQMLERYNQIRSVLDARGLDWKSLSSSSGCDPPPPGDGGGGNEQPAPAVSPASQHHVVENQTAEWTVEVGRNPAYEQTVQFDFGDGASTSATVARGQGTATLSFAHTYSADEAEVYAYGTVTFAAAATVFIVGADGGLTPVGRPVQVTVEIC